MNIYKDFTYGLNVNRYFAFLTTHYDSGGFLSTDAKIVSLWDEDTIAYFMSLEHLEETLAKYYGHEVYLLRTEKVIT